MIIKVKTHKRPSFKNLLTYMVHDKDRLFDTSGRSLCIKHNIKGTSIDSWVKQFKENEKFRLRKRKDSVYCSHEILSWHRDDASKITLEKLEVMTREYIKQRNPNGIFIAIPHFDRDHYHMHICASGIEYRTGSSMRMSKTAFGKLKVDIQNFQKARYPEFEKSVVGHGNKKSRGEKGINKIRHTEKDKQYLSTILKTCYKKANSKETFFKLLEESGVKNYERGGKISGVVFHERKFRLHRFGFKEDKIEELDKRLQRCEKLKWLRTESKESEINKNINFELG